MRAAVLAVLSFMAIAAAPAPATAATARGAPPRLDAGAKTDIAETARHCTSGYHWVAKHHARNGKLIPGRCVRDQR